jgi:hypothetical protein
MARTVAKLTGATRASAVRAGCGACRRALEHIGAFMAGIVRLVAAGHAAIAPPGRTLRPVVVRQRGARGRNHVR